MLRMTRSSSFTGALPEEYSDRFSPENAERVRTFHRTCPGYEMTPLYRLPHLAKMIGAGEILVKDESARFGLNAFKALGSSYAMLKAMRKGPAAGRVFVTATDGNHGRGVAWAAKGLGMDAVVLLPAGTRRERLDSIRALGARAEVTGYGYDETVRLAAGLAEKNGWTLMQDTAWDGYEEIPLDIMEGYLTMAAEFFEQAGPLRPTHIFLQAGVGSMAASLAACFIQRYPGSERPRIVIVEPETADCFFLSAEEGRAEAVRYKGRMDSMMAGLCCGVPSTAAWRILKEVSDAYCTITDDICADGMRVLSSPLPGDARIISGESGAAGFSAFFGLMTKKDLPALRREIGLDERAVVLCISTEGATDKENWRHVVWHGGQRLIS